MKTTFNPKRDLPYLAAIAQTVLYTWAGITLLGPWGFIPGAFMGLLVSVTMAYASSQYTDVAEKRQKFVMGGMIILGLFSPIVIGTSMFLDLPTSIHPIWRGVVGAVLGVIPDVSVFLTGFVAGKGLVKRDDPIVQSAASVSQDSIPVAKPTKKPAKQEPIAFNDENLIAQYILDPFATNETLAKVFNITPQGVSGRKTKLIEEGKLTRDGKAIKPGIGSMLVAEEKVGRK